MTPIPVVRNLTQLLSGKRCTDMPIITHIVVGKPGIKIPIVPIKREIVPRIISIIFK